MYSAFRLVGRSPAHGFTNFASFPGVQRSLVIFTRRCPRTGLGIYSFYRSATLLLWVLSGPVLKHGPRSLTCARVIGLSLKMIKPKGAMKVKVVPRSTEGGWLGFARARTPGASHGHYDRRRTQSVHVGTRKMVNYAWSGRSQGKP